MEDTQWEELLQGLVARNEGGDQAVYLQVTRGVAPKRDHAFPEVIQPTVFAMSNAVTTERDHAAEQGVKAITLDDIRWSLCNIKAITLLPNVLLRQQAVEANTAEAILINDGRAIEGAASNLFIVRNGLLITPPNSNALLPGITRDLILELAASHGIPFREADIPADDLYQCEEIWLTSSTREISPVIQLNSTTIGEGKPGPLWHRMIGLYCDYIDAVRRGVAD